MKTTCMDLENSKTCGSYNSLIKISDKINYKWGDKYAALTNVSIYWAGKNKIKLLQKQQI